VHDSDCLQFMKRSFLVIYKILFCVVQFYFSHSCCWWFWNVILLGKMSQW